MSGGYGLGGGIDRSTVELMYEKGEKGQGMLWILNFRCCLRNEGEQKQKKWANGAVKRYRL
jgi:hypothetical protein